MLQQGFLDDRGSMLWPPRMITSLDASGSRTAGVSARPMADVARAQTQPSSLKAPRVAPPFRVSPGPTSGPRSRRMPLLSWGAVAAVRRHGFHLREGQRDRHRNRVFARPGRARADHAGALCHADGYECAHGNLVLALRSARRLAGQRPAAGQQRPHAAGAGRPLARHRSASRSPSDALERATRWRSTKVQ